MAKGDKKAKGTKRGPSSFFVFLKEKREEIKAAHPDWKVPQISKEAGIMWKAMSDEEKKPYIEKAKKQEEPEE